MLETFKRSFRRLGQRGEKKKSSFSFTHTLVACSRTHCTHRPLGRNSVTQLFDHLQSIHSQCSDTEVCYLMFLASWLDRRSANGREGASLFTSFQVLTTAQNEGALACNQKPRTKTSLVNRREHESFYFLNPIMFCLSHVSPNLSSIPLVLNLLIILVSWFDLSPDL